MAVTEYALDKKGYFMVLRLEHVEKMRAFYKAPTSASPSAMIGWMVDDFLSDVKLSPASKKRIAEQIEENRKKREKKRAEWGSSEYRVREYARRKAARDAKKKGAK